VTTLSQLSRDSCALFPVPEFALSGACTITPRLSFCCPRLAVLQANCNGLIKTLFISPPFRYSFCLAVCPFRVSLAVVRQTPSLVRLSFSRISGCRREGSPPGLLSRLPLSTRAFPCNHHPFLKQTRSSFTTGLTFLLCPGS